MIKAFVTGCTGLVGSNVVKALNRHNVAVIGLKLPQDSTRNLQDADLQLVDGNILDPASFEEALHGVDWVFHVAGIADDWNHRPSTVYKVNVSGTRNLLYYAHKAGAKRFIYTGSSAACGFPHAGQAMMDETNQFNVDVRLWRYGHSKALAEQIVHSYAAKGMETISVLPTAVLGPGDINLITGGYIQHTLNVGIFPVTKGGGNFVDVRDLAEGQVLAALHGKSGERYILGGENLNHRQCFQTLGTCLNRQNRLVNIPQWAAPSFNRAVEVLKTLGICLPLAGGRVLIGCQNMYYNLEKARTQLGYQYRPFEQTILDAYHWYLEQGVLVQKKGSRHYAFQRI